MAGLQRERKNVRQQRGTGGTRMRWYGGWRGGGVCADESRGWPGRAGRGGEWRLRAFITTPAATENLRSGGERYGAGGGDFAEINTAGGAGAAEGAPGKPSSDTAAGEFQNLPFVPRRVLREYKEEKQLGGKPVCSEPCAALNRSLPGRNAWTFCAASPAGYCHCWGEWLPLRPAHRLLVQ